MPANPERRTLITDTAIEILAASGAGGLTHRAVDTKAGLPRGTTSNFFRTRLALLQATAQRVARLHWEHVAETRTRIASPSTRAGLSVLLASLIAPADDRIRVRNLARFELFLEGKRYPELGPVLGDIYAAGMQGASLVLSSSGVPVRPDRARLMAKLLNGLAFDQHTTPETMTVQQAAALVDQLLDLVFGPARSEAR
jgi:AcrR family transcriptional regulator